MAACSFAPHALGAPSAAASRCPPPVTRASPRCAPAASAPVVKAMITQRPSPLRHGALGRGGVACRAAKGEGLFGKMKGLVEKLEQEMASTISIPEPQNVQEAIDTGVRLFNEDRMTLAIDYFEKVFWMGPQQGGVATQQQLILTWYNLSTCHAYNGDTDGALECVRQGVAAGLDFNAAVEAAKTEPRLCRLQCTTQVRQKMKKAAEEAAAKRAKGN